MKKILKRDIPKHPYHVLIAKVKAFQAKGINTVPFTYMDVLNKFGYSPRCYLTGRKINWFLAYDYQLDHVIPFANGGLSDLDNLYPLTPIANQIKFTWNLDTLLKVANNIVDYNKQNPEVLLEVKKNTSHSRMPHDEMLKILSDRQKETERLWREKYEEGERCLSSSISSSIY